MNIERKYLMELIRGGENSQVEFKRNADNHWKMAKEISALLNTKGGYLLIGVEDDGSVSGVYSEKTEMENIRNASEFYLQPTITLSQELINLYGKDVLVVTIPNSENKPHKLLMTDENGKEKYRAFIRVGEKSVEASSEMARLMTYQNPNNEKKLKLSIGEKEKSLFAYLQKYERITVKDFCKLVNISKRRAERTLVALVRSGIVQIHYDDTHDYFTLV